MLDVNRRAANGDIVILEVSGHVDISNCFRLQEGLNREMDEGHRYLVLNLQKLSFIDSSCLGTLLRALERIHRENGVMLLVGNQFVDRVLELTGLQHLLVSYPDEKAALSAARREIADRSSGGTRPSTPP